MTEYTYRIEERRRDVGGGWRLILLEDGAEVGGGVYPPDPGADNDEQAMIWAYNAAWEKGEDWTME